MFFAYSHQEPLYLREQSVTCASRRPPANHLLAAEVLDVALEELRQATQISAVVPSHQPNERNGIILFVESIEHPGVSVHDSLEDLAGIIHVHGFRAHIRHQLNITTRHP